jgi:hypothetical protein
MYVPHLICASMSGVTSPMMKLHIQVVDVVIEMALERIASVKISDGRTHPMGAVVHQSITAKPLSFLFSRGINVPNE